MWNRKNLLSVMGMLLLAGSAVAAQGTGAKPTTSSRAGQPKQATPAQTKAAAPVSSKAAQPALHEAAGTVVSADATKLVISHMVKGKREEMSFTLNPETQKHGSLDVGTQAMVKYRMESGENVATQVTARPAKSK